MTLTKDEKMLCLLYGDGTKHGLEKALTAMKSELKPDEEPLLSMTETLLAKLRSLTEAQFQDLTDGM